MKTKLLNIPHRRNGWGNQPKASGWRNVNRANNNAVEILRRIILLEKAQKGENVNNGNPPFDWTKAWSDAQKTTQKETKPHGWYNVVATDNYETRIYKPSNIIKDKPKEYVQPIRDWSVFEHKEDIEQQKEIYLGDNTDKDSIVSLNIQKDFLPLVENPANKGYDSINQRYYAYSAIEDKNKKNPTYDIGNGVKLTRPANPKAYELYNSQVDSMGKHYLTKSQYDSTFMERLGEDYTNSKKIYNDFIKNEFGIDDGWKKLSPKERAFLMDYQFNVKNGGLYTFPKLMKAIYNKDIEEIKKECLRYMTKNGQKYELGRNKEILERVEHLYDD